MNMVPFLGLLSPWHKIWGLPSGGSKHKKARYRLSKWWVNTSQPTSALCLLAIWRADFRWYWEGEIKFLPPKVGIRHGFTTNLNIWKPFEGTCPSVRHRKKGKAQCAQEKIRLRISQCRKMMGCQINLCHQRRRIQSKTYNVLFLADSSTLDFQQ